MTINAAAGSTNLDKASLTLALQYLNTSFTARTYLLNTNVTVNFNHNNDDTYTEITDRLTWDPKSAMQVIDSNNVLGVQSAAIGLLHEIAHKLFGPNEALATQWETNVCKELGEPTRLDYNAARKFVTEDNPTEHTNNGQWTARTVYGSNISGGMYDGSANPAPSLGGAPTSGSSGGGIVGGSGGGYQPPMTTQPYESDEGSVPCPHCYIIPRSTNIIPAPTLEGIEAHLVGVPQPLEVTW